jgi:flagellar motor switch protein FliN
MTDQQNTGADDEVSMDDWAAAMAEQEVADAAMTTEVETPAPAEAVPATGLFHELGASDTPASVPQNLDMILDIRPAYRRIST